MLAFNHMLMCADPSVRFNGNLIAIDDENPGKAGIERSVYRISANDFVALQEYGRVAVVRNFPDPGSNIYGRDDLH